MLESFPSFSLLRLRSLILAQRVPDLDEGKIYLCFFATAGRVVGAEVVLVVQIEVSLEPLNELKVILVAALAQLLDVDIFLNLALRKRLLQNLIVVYKFPLVSRLPVYSLHRHLTREHRVDQIAVSSSCPQLLDLGDFERKGGVYPADEI